MFEMTEVVPELPPRFEYLGQASMFIDAIFEAVDRIPIFGDFVYSEIRTLAGYMECFAAPQGEEIMTEGKIGDYLLLILTGEVKVLKADPDDNGTRKIIAFAGPGTTLGEMSLIDGEQRFATCITVTPTDFALLHRSDLSRLIKDLPHLGN